MRSFGFYSTNKLNCAAVCAAVAHAAVGAGRRPLVIDLCPFGRVSECLLPPTYRYAAEFGVDSILAGHEGVARVAEHVEVTFRRTWLWNRTGTVSVLPTSPGRTCRAHLDQAVDLAARLEQEPRPYAPVLLVLPDLDSAAAGFALALIDALVMVVRAGAHVDDEIREIRRRIVGRHGSMRFYVVLSGEPRGEQLMAAAQSALKRIENDVHRVVERLRCDVRSTGAVTLSAGEEGLDEVAGELISSALGGCHCPHCAATAIGKR